MSDKPTGSTSKRVPGEGGWKAIRQQATAKPSLVGKEQGTPKEEAAKLYIAELTMHAQALPNNNSFRMWMTKVHVSCCIGGIDRVDMSPRSARSVRRHRVRVRRATGEQIANDVSARRRNAVGKLSGWNTRCWWRR